MQSQEGRNRRVALPGINLPAKCCHQLSVGNSLLLRGRLCLSNSECFKEVHLSVETFVVVNGS
jgi:hypothetical protein